jgi:V8-like Glu-specific endopeptidase
MLSAGCVMAGCGDDAVGTDLPSFNDITSAQPAIQAAAAAVVRIATADGSGTGSFISPTGLLLTNNHVLGAPECPIEGCSIQLRFMFQRGQPVPDTITVTAVPVAVDVGLDVAILQVSASGSALQTPSFLEIRGQDPASLLGQHVTVVGHPEGRLKKWTDGVVFDAFGDWFTSTAFVLPGDSGSPVLDDAGRLVGIHHRSPRTLDVVTDRGINVSATGTASAAILAARDAPLPPVMISLRANASADAFVANNVVYQNGGASSPTVGGSAGDALTILGQACDVALARTDFLSPDDLSTALSPCVDAQRWIECRGDATPPPFVTICPTADRDAWAGRFQRMNQKWIEMNGDTYLSPVTFGIAALQANHAAGQGAAADSLRQALAAAQQPLDFGVANYLAAFAVDSYDGTRSLDWLRDYASHPGYARAAYSISSAFLWWRSNGAVENDDVLAVLGRLKSNPDVDVGAKLYIDQMLYLAGR